MNRGGAMVLPDPYPRTDLGNAHRLVDRHGENLRWCEAWQTWLVWDGRRWARDPDLASERYAHETVEAMLRGAVDIPDDDQRKAFLRFAITSQGRGRIQAMLGCARPFREVATVPDQYDVSDWSFNMASGTLDLRTGEHLGHRREDYLTQIVPVAFDPRARCPLWEEFLGTIFQKNEDLIGFIQRACGYALAGTSRERCMFVLWGSGDNGKSTFLELLRDLMGDYGHKMPKEVVTEMARRGGQANPDVAALRGKRFCYFSETTTGGRLSEAFIKELTGNEAIWARDLYEKGFNFVPQFKLFLATNHKPRIIDAGKAFWNRVRLIPFTYSIPRTEQDPALKDRLWEERSGILNWMLAGCREWLANGLQVPAIVEAATQEYREEQDTLAQFMAECCIVGPLPMQTRQKAVYDRYVAWCQETHERHIMRSKEFRDRMIDRGFRCEVSTGGFPYFYGLGLEVESNREDYRLE
jgi:putative DNA primase/helicase